LYYRLSENKIVLITITTIIVKIVAKKGISNGLEAELTYHVTSQLLNGKHYYQCASCKTTIEKAEYNNGYQIIDPFMKMALQTIIDIHLVREYEKTFLSMEHW
jgi:hypothetical protein